MGMAVGDLYEIPAHLKRSDHDYQWCAVSVFGSKEIASDGYLLMKRRGWRAVMLEDWPGEFALPGATGPITRGGQVLMRRPKDIGEAEREALRREALKMEDDCLRLFAESGFSGGVLVQRGGPDGKVKYFGDQRIANEVVRLAGQKQETEDPL